MFATISAIMVLIFWGCMLASVSYVHYTFYMRWVNDEGFDNLPDNINFEFFNRMGNDVVDYIMYLLMMFLVTMAGTVIIGFGWPVIITLAVLLFLADYHRMRVRESKKCTK